jgi:hypothetical protein
VLSALVLVLVLAIATWVVWTRRAEVTDALAAIGWAGVAASVLPTVAGVALTAVCWRVWLGAVGPSPAILPTAQVFFVSQAGKYLPGSVWPFLAQAAFARRFGLTRSGVLTATGLFLLTHVATGAVLGVAAAGAVAGDAAVRWPWLVLVAAVCAVPLLPSVQRRLLLLAGRWQPSMATVRRMTWRRTALAVGVMASAWACYGLGLQMLVAPLGAGPGDVWLITSGYALAWVAGFLAVAAPAGAGVREAVLVAVLAPLLGTSPAIAVAIASRLVLTVVDLGLAAASVGVVRTASRPGASEPVAPEPGPPDPPAVSEFRPAEG